MRDLGGESPWLVGGGSRLWLIYRDRVTLVERGAESTTTNPEPLGDTCAPLLLDGAPALTERHPTGARVLRWNGERWTAALAETFGADACLDLRAVAAADGPVVIYRTGGTLFARPFHAPSVWAAAGEAGDGWAAFTLDGSPAVLSWSGQRLEVLQPRDGRWGPTRRATLPGVLPATALPFERRPGGPLGVLVEGFPGQLNEFTWGDDGLAMNRRIDSPLFPTSMIAAVVGLNGSVVLVTFALAWVLARQMRTHRIGTFRAGERTVAHASVMRRAVAQLIDSMVLMAPAGAGAWVLFASPQAAFGDTPVFMFSWMLGSMLWVFVGLAGLAVLEGRWGVTPGKWAAGIRVVGTDLAPCGFTRALLRNVLKLVDGFMNFLVGLLMVALTPDWQRIGDMVARTIVVRHDTRGAP